MTTPITPQTLTVTRAWQDVLNQVAEEGKLRGLSEEAIQQTTDTIRCFLTEKGYVLTQDANAKLIDELAVESGPTPLDGTGSTIAPVERVGYRDSLSALVRNYNALLRTHFAQLLKASQQTAHLSLGALAKASGIAREKLRFWLRDVHGGVTGMTLDQSRTIDEVLDTGGAIVTAYCALRQDAAYQEQPSVLKALTGHISFGDTLKQWRANTKRPLRALLTELEATHQIRLPGALLSQWEQGLYVPALEARETIRALDALYGADGKLLTAWQAEAPRTVPPAYAFGIKKWPLQVRRQFMRLVEYKTSNSENMPRSETHGDDRWTGTASQRMFEGFCESFFGYLVLKHNVVPEDLSLTLFCDWRLVVNFYAWQRERIGRTYLTQFEYCRTTTLLNLYDWFFAHLEAEASSEPRWATLPKVAQCSVPVAAGVVRKVSVPLNTFAQQWRYHLAGVRTKAKNFLTGQKFDCQANIDRLEPMLQAGIEFPELRLELERRFPLLPPRCLGRKAAVLLRRFTMALLQLAVPFRPGLIQGLKLEHLQIKDNGMFGLAIPEHELRNRGNHTASDGEQIPLPDWPLLHTLLRRYLSEARPILLGGATTDAGYLFISASSSRRTNVQSALVPGGKMDDKAFYHDFIITLGYNPAAGRYLFAACAWTHDMTDDEIARATQTTAVNAKVVLGKVRGREMAGARNKTMDKIFPRRLRRYRSGGKHGR